MEKKEEKEIPTFFSPLFSSLGPFTILFSPSSSSGSNPLAKKRGGGPRPFCSSPPRQMNSRISSRKKKEILPGEIHPCSLSRHARHIHVPMLAQFSQVLGFPNLFFFDPRLAFLDFFFLRWMMKNSPSWKFNWPRGGRGEKMKRAVLTLPPTPPPPLLPLFLYRRLGGKERKSPISKTVLFDHHSHSGDCRNSNVSVENGPPCESLFSLANPDAACHGLGLGRRIHRTNIFIIALFLLLLLLLLLGQVSLSFEAVKAKEEA